MDMNRITLALTAALATLGLAPLAADGAKPPKPPKPPKGAGKLTLAATPNPVKFGRSIALAGKLNGANRGGQAVSVFADPFPYDALNKVATATTNVSGDYSLTGKPSRNTRYQTRSGAEQSAVITVLVRPAVSLRLSDRTPRRGQRVRFRGRVCPQHDGSRLAIQRHYSTGYRTVRKTTLREIAGSTCSSYRKTFRVYRDGRYRAVIGGHADHATGRSRSRIANAHR
jgi:hypothetical protein